MLSRIYSLMVMPYATFREDCRTDSRLVYVLVLSFALAGFWFWWRTPNFATPDEYGRVLQPMKAAGFFLSDPGVDSLVRGLTEGRASEATIYFHGILLVPVAVVVVLTGQLDTFASFGGIESRFTLWQTVPEWYWKASVLSIRFANAILVVGTVYVLYRIGTTLYDRRAGQLAAVFTTLSLAVIHTAHEANEDTPMLFLLVVVLYLSLRYTEGASDEYFLLGCGLGGLAMAFKLTGGIVVVFLGTAFVFRQADSLRPSRRLLVDIWQPRLLVVGLVLGFLALYVGKPNLLFGGPEWFLDRYQQAFSNKTAGSTTTVPIGYTALLRYLNGFGLPLTLAAGAGFFARLRRLIRMDREHRGELVLFAGIGVYLVLYVFLWQDFKTHHLLPSIPLLTVPLGITLAKHLNDGRQVARILVAGLLVTTGLYAGVGVYQFANDPRDEATRWLATETDPDATMTVYENSVADHGIVHGQSLDRYDFVEEPGVSQSIANDTEYTEWMLSTTQREPDYIQVLGESALHDPVEYPERAAYKQRLLSGDISGYTVAAEFGESPPDRSRVERLARAGVVPQPEIRRDHIVILAQNDTAG